MTQEESSDFFFCKVVAVVTKVVPPTLIFTKVGDSNDSKSLSMKWKIKVVSYLHSYDKFHSHFFLSDGLVV
jgi:hypothetical protein